MLQRPSKLIINRIPGSDRLAFKDTTSVCMGIRRCLVQSPDQDEEESKVLLDPAIEPQSFVFPREFAQFNKYKERHPRSVFIAKPKAGSEGNNCLLF